MRVGGTGGAACRAVGVVVGLWLFAGATASVEAKAARAPAIRACQPAMRFYGTYSIGGLSGATRVPLERRLRELRDLGGNMVVATGRKAETLDLLPPGMLAVPGCGLMGRRDWQTEGRWDEARARGNLERWAGLFADHPRVYGVCLTHEVTEYADHARRVWMYRLAKEYFPRTPVIQYYASLLDRENPERRFVDRYGRGGERETDVLFVSLQAVRAGRFRPENVERLAYALRAAARTPGVPVWGQTSINADHRYVTGADSMLRVWGRNGENMTRWAELLRRTSYRDTGGRELRLAGFFWRSLGRFPHDLGEPRFAPQRARVRAIAKELCVT
ncbi:MAG: hypothetical protein IT294_02420 [Deltaproteobacteria bacterium]|nr:hypothetical protein [Deltaproteobacteria bacterium]